jgi:ribosomal protein S19
MKFYFTKTPFYSFAILRILNKIKLRIYSRTELKKVRIRVWARNSRIPRALINYKVFIHNGKTFIPLKIRENMINHKFGEFAFTKRMSSIIHWSRRKKQTKN